MIHHVTPRLPRRKTFLLHAKHTMDALKAKIPWEFHFKALIQAKGFLKIIQFVSSFLVAVATCDCVADCALECLCNVAGHALKSGMVRLRMTCASGTRGVLQCAARDMRVQSSGTCNSCQTRITQTFPPTHPSPLPLLPPLLHSFPPHSFWLSSPFQSWPAIQLRQELHYVPGLTALMPTLV